MKKKYIGIVILALILLGFILFFSSHKPSDIHLLDDNSIDISDSLKQTLQTDLKKKSESLQPIIQKDAMNGTRKNISTPALSKAGVKAIYEKLLDENSCVNDEQGYYDLQGRDHFLSFWKDYQAKKDTKLTHYTISSTGGIRRDDFIYQHDVLYLISTSLYYDNGKAIISDTNGWKIEKADYDTYGYFSYKKIVLEKPFDLGDITNGYFRVDPMDETLRTYTNTYITPIEYDCNNLFVMDWDENSVDKLCFNDLVEYLYPIEHQQAIPEKYMKDSGQQYISYIDANVFEDLVHQYFDIDTSILRSQNYYCETQHAYPYAELYCIASHVATPRLRPEVVKAQKEKNILTLTIHATGYEKGYPVAYTHIVKIELLDDGSYHYISNHIEPDDNNQIPKYAPGITNKSQKEGGCL
ncbi:MULTISPECIES: DUF6070 family protein [unclassified Amedibacterium]|uniref:DUF6070 family protein n=1 Tax=unclassified Amedibacterium TaxID=3088137 RepID=UPI000E3F4E08|nr:MULTISPECIES: DUF6070 family protein [unclassified Absiella]RGB68145.1 hypothetical protein DW113_05080 [Absiella sp. AM09-45]RGB79362.1 hypothetical protein DW114_01625 [Absiella sp. AM09-50]